MAGSVPSGLTGPNDLDLAFEGPGNTNRTNTMTLNEGLDPEVPFIPTEEVDVVDDTEVSYLHDTRVSTGTDIPPMPPNWTQDLSTATPPTTQPVAALRQILAGPMQLPLKK